MLLKFTDSTVVFQSSVVGKTLRIRGSSLGNDSLYRITSLVDNQLEVTPPLTAVETGLVWDILEPTSTSDGETITAHAPSLLSLLARDLGAEIDYREPENIQRRWVRNLSKVYNLKSAELGYSTVGAIGGLIVTAHQLFRIDLAEYERQVSISAEVIETAGPGLSWGGSTGYLYSDSGIGYFQDSSVSFIAGLKGRYLKVSSAYSASNRGLYRISAVISSTVLQLDSLPLGILPDYGPGGSSLYPDMQWSVVRHYSLQAPAKADPLDLDAALLTTVTGGAFALDTYCWEAGFSTDVPVDLTSVVSVGGYLWAVTFTTPGGQVASGEIVLRVGRWKLIDTEGAEFYLESVPALESGEFITQVLGEEPSLTGLGTPVLRYDCPVIPSCDYCPASNVYVEVAPTAELVAAGSTALENIYRRAIARLTETCPASADLILRIVLEFEATVGVSASTEPENFYAAFLDAYVTPSYDQIPGDEVAADHVLFATLETT